MGILKSKAGFTFVEIMIAVTLIAILALLSLPAFKRAQMVTKASTFANDIRQFSSAVETYTTVYGSYPKDSTPGNADPKLVEYLPLDFMDKGTPIGGQWDVDINGAAGVVAAVGVGNLSNPDIELIVRVDFVIDDGNIVTGNFRWFPFAGGRPYWIIEE